MAWLLIIFIVLVALSPLLSIVPSRQQRRLASLRQAAAVSGLQVQLAQASRGGEQRLMAAYGLRAGHGVRLTGVGSYSLTKDGWRNSDRRGPTPPTALLAVLPAGVEQLRIAPDSVWLFWDERGAEEDISQLKIVLESLIETLIEPAGSHSV